MTCAEFDVKFTIPLHKLPAHRGDAVQPMQYRKLVLQMNAVALSVHHLCRTRRSKYGLFKHRVEGYCLFLFFPGRLQPPPGRTIYAKLKVHD